MKSIFEKMEAFKIAIASIKSNKVRGILTTLGIIIGIVAVVATMTAANGLANNFKESISAIGSDVLYVTKRPWIIEGNFFAYRNRPRIDYKDTEKLRRLLKSAAAINPTTGTNKIIKYKSDKLEDTPIIGTTYQHILVTNGSPEFGRFISKFDAQYRKSVCVIGSEIKEKLFKNIDPINKEMKIGWNKFRIIGVMEKLGSAGFFGGPNFDNQVYIPITTFNKYYGNANRSFTIAVKAPQQENLSDFQYSLIGEMRKLRKLKPTEKDNFAINSMDTLVAMYNKVMGVVVLIGLIITSISLFVGGIGVMNIMFVSVTERTREIGIRKAIGAKKRAILTQFLFESSSIGLIGGTLGVIISFGVAALINKFVMPASISPAIVITALIVSVTTGIVAGIIPAYRASKLQPVSALRHE